MTERREAIRGRDRWRLIRDLAVGELPLERLAVKYDAEETSIKGFVRRNQEEIDALKADIAEAADACDFLKGLWSTTKAQRIAVYQQNIEDITTVNERMLNSEGKLNSRLLEQQHSALRAIADELGDIPNKTTMAIEPVAVKYQIVGINPEDLT